MVRFQSEKRVASQERVTHHSHGLTSHVVMVSEVKVIMNYTTLINYRQHCRVPWNFQTLGLRKVKGTNNSTLKHRTLSEC